MLILHPHYLEEELSNEMTEEVAQIKEMIDSFNIQDLRNLIKDALKLHKIYKSRFLFEHLMEKIKENIKQILIEIKNDSTYDCSQILNLINQLFKGCRFPSFKEQYQFYEDLLKIIEYTDSLLIYEKVFQIFCHLPKHHQNNTQNYFTRLMHFEKVLYEHINYLSSKKFDLIDYYQEDPKYEENKMNLRIPLQFDIEYNEPTQLETNYDDICKNKIHNHKRQQNVFQFKKVQIVDDDSISALTLSRNLLNKQNEPFSPLIEIVKYRILIKRGLQINPQITKNIIIKLHLKTSRILMNHKRQLNLINGDKEGSVAFFYSLIKDVKNTDYFNLFKLQTIDPQLGEKLIKTFQKNIQFQQLLSDVLSMKQIEQNELTDGYPLKYYPEILSENLVRNEQLTCSIIKTFLSHLQKTRQFSWDEYNETIKLLIRSLNIQDNKMLLQPEQLNQALQFLSYLIRNHDPNINYQNIDVLLQIVELYTNKMFSLQKPTQNGYVQINEKDADIIMNSCIEALIRQTQTNLLHFSMFEQDQLINENIDFIHESTTKISNSNVLDYIANLLLLQPQQLTKTICKTLQLISSLLNANFQLIDKILSSNLPNILNEIIIRMSPEEIKPEFTISIFSFYAHITRREEINQFYEYGKRFLELIINYQLITKDDTDDQMLFQLAIFIVRFYTINNRSNVFIHEILVRVLSQQLEQLNNQQQNLNFNQDFQQEFKKIQKKKRQILLFNSFFNQNLSRYLQQKGYFDILANLFKIPSFNMFIFIKGFNYDQCIEKVLQLINKLERQLGCTLEQTTQLSFNQKTFLENCSTQTYEMASQSSEILHYLAQLHNQNKIIAQTLFDKLIDKCCALLEIAYVTENENKIVSNLLFKILKLAITKNNCNLQPINRLFVRLIFKSNNTPTLTLKLLKNINEIILSLYKPYQIVKNIIINSQFRRHLQDAIKNYILQLNTDCQDKQLIDELGMAIYEILKFFYQFPIMMKDLLMISQIIPDICSLVEITKNSTQESIKKIQKFLIILGNKIANPRILQLSEQNNISLNRILEQQLRSPLEQIMHSREQNIIRLGRNPLYIDLVRQNQNRGTQIQQYDESLLQQFKSQQESIRLLFKENIDFVSNFDILNGLQLQLNLSEILSLLQQSIQKQFNLNLQFQGIENEMLNQPDYNFKIIILVLSLLYKQDQQLQKQQQQSLDSIAIELLKFLDVLLYQADQFKIKAVNYTLAVLSKLITENQVSLKLILEKVQKILDSDVQNEITFQICIDILVKVFQKSSLCINQFVQQMKGLELVFKVSTDSYNHFISLSKLMLAIVYDKTIIRAQIEAYIKKIIFDEENLEKVQNKNQELELKYYKNENTYPICLQPAQYNVQTKEQYKISKNHPALEILQKNKNYEEDIQYVMNLLFDQSVDSDCLILKKGIRLDTLDSIKQNGNAILQYNFKHKKETQILLKLLVKQMINYYFDNNQEQKYNWKIPFEVLLLLISKFPLLLPYILRMNCRQFLEKFFNQTGQEHSQLPTKISFLTLITRYLIPPQNFIFCICLDTLVLFKKQNNIIVPFAYEIRRLIIKQLYVEISRQIKNLDEKLLSTSNILVTLLQIKSVGKICISNIEEPDNSYNFIKLYIDGIKNFNINNYFIQKDQIFFVIKTLNLLYNVATNLILEKTEPIITHSLKDYQMGLGIIGQINSNEINCQLFQTIYTYYKFFENRNQKNIQFQFYIQNWPFLFNKNGQLQENTYQNIEPLIPTDSLQTIPEINNSVEVCTKELEEELNYWTEELDQNLEQETQNYLEIENNFNNFINSVSDQQLENQIYRTIQFTGLIFPCQFQINLQEFQHRLPEQNKIQLVRRIISWQQNLYNNNYDQIQNSLNSRRETMHILQNRIQIQNMDQIFENFQNQNINNNIFNERDNDQFSIFETFTEMDLQNNQHIEIENQLPQQLQLEQNIQPSTISQFQKIQNIVNSALKNRKQTLKHLGNIDRQLIQQFFLKFFYVDDDFGSNNTYINEFLISIGTKGNFSNQITQDIIKVLQMTTQNQRQENVDQEPLIISKNGVIRDLEQTKNFVQLKALKLFIQLQLTSTSNISDENAQELIELLYKLKGKSLQNLLQFLGNQEDKYNFQLAPNQVLNLYKFLLSQQDMKNSTNCMNLISRLEHNITHFMAANKIKINKISEYYNNQFLNQLQVEQAFKQLNELEKIFQMIQIIFRKDENNHYQCQEFLNSEEVQRLFNVLESLISQIQNLNDSRLLPLLKAFLICYQTKSQFNTQNLQFLKISSMEISTEILIDFENLFKRLCLNGKDYINHIVKQQINIMNNECKMMKVRRNRLTENNQLFEKDFLEGILNVHPQAINFQNKKNYFYSKLEINRLSQQQLQRYPIKVSKSQIFEDSYNEITKISSLDIFRFKRFFILYDGEIGQDGGGMTTDWIGKLSKSILDQQYQLFIPNSDNTCYLINTESTDPDHLRKFKFVGMFMAIAIICKVNIKGYFPNSYFKHIVGQKLSRSDIQQHDEGIYNSLNTIYNQKIDSSWNLYWLYNIKRNGVFIDEELKPGGSDIEVTEEDKKDFVRKYCYQIMAKNIENQIKAIQEGFYSIIPKNDIKIFDSIQLEQLLCGEQYIDVEDLISNLIYQGCNAQNQVIKWLQNTLRNFNQDMLVKFLKLATSRTNLPIGGFSNKECRITIVLLNNLQNDIDSRYPEGHTCARSIGLPPYSNEQTLQQKLEEALISQGDRFDLI